MSWRHVGDGTRPAGLDASMIRSYRSTERFDPLRIPIGVSRPLHQRVFMLAIAALVGLLALGALLDSVSNAITLISPTMTYAGTAALLVGVLIGQFVMHRFPVEWNVKGQPTRLRGLGPSIFAGVIGMVGLLWVPRALELLQKPEVDRRPPTAATSPPIPITIVPDQPTSLGVPFLAPFTIRNNRVRDMNDVGVECWFHDALMQPGYLKLDDVRVNITNRFVPRLTPGQTAIARCPIDIPFKVPQPLTFERGEITVLVGYADPTLAGPVAMRESLQAVDGRTADALGPAHGSLSATVVSVVGTYESLALSG